MRHRLPAPEIRAGGAAGLTADGSRTLGGYAAVFMSLSDDLGGFVEQIDPRAFDASLADQANDICSLWNHNMDFPLARRSAGSLRLSADATGLKVEIDVGNSSYGNDLLANVREKTVGKMSFGFECLRDRIERGPRLIRTLLECRLVEVSPVTIPAYRATSIGERGRQARRRRALAMMALGGSPPPRC